MKITSPVVVGLNVEIPFALRAPFAVTAPVNVLVPEPRKLNDGLVVEFPNDIFSEELVVFTFM